MSLSRQREVNLESAVARRGSGPHGVWKRERGCRARPRRGQHGSERKPKGRPGAVGAALCRCAQGLGVQGVTLMSSRQLDRRSASGERTRAASLRDGRVDQVLRGPPYPLRAECSPKNGRAVSVGAEARWSLVISSRSANRGLARRLACCTSGVPTCSEFEVRSDSSSSSSATRCKGDSVRCVTPKVRQATSNPCQPREATRTTNAESPPDRLHGACLRSECCRNRRSIDSRC
jgi:hypothetical protein